MARHHDYPSSSINLHNEVGFNHLHPFGGLSASAYAAKAEGHLRGNDRWSTRSIHKTQVKSLIAAFASLAAIIFLILICRSIRSRAQSWVITRKLSSDGDDSDAESDRLVICEDSDVEDLEHADQQSPGSPLSPPKAKKAKVEVDESEAHSSVEEEESESESDDNEPSTSAGQKRKRKAPAPSPKTPSDEGTMSPPRSDEELEVASALLDLQEALEAAGESPSGAEESPAASPPSAAPVHVPTPSASKAQLSAPTLFQLLLQPVKRPLPSAPPSLAPTQVVKPAPGATVGVEGTGDAVTSTSSAPLPDEEEPSTSAAAGEGAAPPRPRVHPYYRIPTVDPALRGVKRFIPEQTVNYGFANERVCTQLKRIRSILLEETLAPVHLNELAQVTSEVLAYVFFRERVSTKDMSPSVATRNLGRRFMELDHALAALQVLGEPASGEWWERVVSVIPDDTLSPSGYEPRHGIAAERAHLGLMKRLHRALRILKTGVRLPEKETISLKRELLFSDHIPSNFKHSRWDPFRDDDMDFDETS
ncbi:hypothetical protein Emed_003820 [Eimeria media]